VPLHPANRSTRIRHALRLGVVGILTLALVACGGGGESASPTATPQPTATAGPTPTAFPTPTFSQVTWGTAIDAATGGPADAMSQIPSSASAITAFVETAAIPAGTTFVATWAIDGAPIDALTQTVTVDADRAAGWLTFTLTWSGENPWPRGELSVTIAMNGTQVTSGAVEIVRG